VKKLKNKTDISDISQKINSPHSPIPEPKSILDKIVWFCLSNKLVTALIVFAIVIWGIMVAPFDWETNMIPRNPVSVDAIPDIGENQQIVFTEWMGRSPQDIEDQISYPLTVSLLGVPGVKTVRSYSFFGFSSIYIIFKENVDFYWARSRILEKLNSISSNLLPEGVQPMLGPDATALGQIYQYTIEGRDEKGNTTGGWDLQELRTIQDWYVKYYLLSVDGISEVASIGGFVKEYQIDVDPDAMRAYGVSLEDVFNAIRKSNLDVGARTIEVNKVEYVIRGLGFIKKLEDVEKIVIKVNDNTPILVKNIAKVSFGPALRRGALDKNGAEAVGGIVVVRYGANPLEAIKKLKEKIKEITPGLPSKVIIDYSKITREKVEEFAKAHGFSAYLDSKLNQTEWKKYLQKIPYENRPKWVKLSKIEIIPFYDRTGLIYETLGTLESSITEEILVTIIIILTMLFNLRSSILISMVLPLAVLISFIAMKIFKVDANIVSLSGIAIAIGTIVDMGIIICENILKHLELAPPEEKKIYAVYRASSEVASAVFTAVMTTIVSFLPVFTMIGAEGKLFKPLAFTKTFALMASVIVAITIVPAAADVFFNTKVESKKQKRFILFLIGIAGAVLIFLRFYLIGITAVIISIYLLSSEVLSGKLKMRIVKLFSLIVAIFVAVILTKHWMPLGAGLGFTKNFIVVALPIALLLFIFILFQITYPYLLRFCLNHKILFLSLPIFVTIFGFSVWLGFDKLFNWLPSFFKMSRPYVYLAHNLPGLGKEFMPPLNEGSFLYMPTTMPHASIGEAMDILRKQDIALNAIPEIESAVGKIGRAESPLDPAPISMIETIINYKPEYVVNKDGHRILFKFDPSQNDFFRNEEGTPINAPDGKPYIVKGKFLRDKEGKLISDSQGMPFRLWRLPLDPQLNPGRNVWPGINSPDDIWDEIVAAAQIPGSTSAPKLQPIAARIVMLQTGMRAPMGIKIKGPDLQTIENVALKIEKLLKEVPSIEESAVIADRIVGKPYIEIDIDRDKIARYGIQIQNVQDVIEIAVGGKKITTTVEGRERYSVRVRYLRELRDQIDSLEKIFVKTAEGQQIPLAQLADIKYVRGPQVIKSEDTFLTGYVLFDKKTGYAEVDVVEQAADYLKNKIAEGVLNIPSGVTYSFSGNYENQIRAQKTLSVVLPLSLFVIFLILYFQFKSIPVTLIVFSAIAVAWSGGFIMIWLYGQDWFLNFSVFGKNLREIFQMHQVNLSVAIWVGFLALFGIATDDGVVMGTYLEQNFSGKLSSSPDEIKSKVLSSGERRVRPCLMTTATTVLALLPVLTSSGRGSDIMIPMAIPSFGGMIIEVMTMLIVPTLYCALKEFQYKIFEKIK